MSNQTVGRLGYKCSGFYLLIADLSLQDLWWPPGKLIEKK